MRRLCSVLLLTAIAAAPLGFAQTQALHTRGVLTGSTDVGVTKKGATVFHPRTATYVIKGGGADMWGAADAFHFSWLRISGDATLTADVRFRGSDIVPLQKAVLIFRQTLAPGSPYADVAIHGDGHITLQYRKVKAGETADITAAEHHAARLRIERKGNVFTAYAGPDDGQLTRIASIPVDLNNPIYLGLGVCAHNANGLAAAVFSNVKVKRAQHSNPLQN